MNVADAAVVFAYVSLCVELVVFPIPSEASTWQLLAAHDGAGPADDTLVAARRRPTLTKVLVFALPTVVGVAAWLVPGLALLLPALRDLAHVPTTGTAATAVAAIVLGRGLTFTSVLQLRAARHAGRAPRGLFLRSRNPGLVGMYVCFAGLVLASGLPLLWAVLPLYVANMHGRVRLEEAHLLARLGEAWSRYAAAVPRYLPLPGLR
jgi:protein-S-isoprenylcysteine O-methyltransferase Ste14